LAALEELEEPLDLWPVECRIVDKFCKLEVFPGTKREPRFVVRWACGIRVIDQGRLVFLGAEDASGPTTPRVVLDDYIANPGNPGVGFCQP